ncbi:MAG: phage major capsid protein [Nitrospirae bacterium]|nr:phage major capsid protein [Nitrospirota bacterium]
MDILQQSQIKKATELLNSAARQEKINDSIGLSDREIKRYSILSGIKGKYDSIINRSSFRDSFEAECHDTIAKRLGIPISDGQFYVPAEILYRDLTAGISSAGGYLVGSTTGGSFIEILRNRSVVFRLGAQRMPGQTQQILLPKQTGAATAYWLNLEATAPTETTQTFGQVALTPKTVGAYTEVSRQLLLQSDPSAEAIVTSDLASVVGVALDSGTISGSGMAGQPQGIMNTTGIGTVTGTSLGYDGLVEFQSDVATASAVLNEGAQGYVTTPAVAKLLKTRQRFTGTDSPLWQGSISSGMIEGARAVSTLQMPTATMLFGDWSQIVVAEWGNLTIEVNPFADFKARIIGVRAMWSVDVTIRHAESFSVATSIT